MRRVQIEEPTLAPAIAARLRRNDAGLVPAVVQATRRATYWSRSRQEYWVKGETSGHTQHVRSVRLDCDGDTLLLRVDQVDGACHTGDHTCFDADVLLTEEVES